MMRARGIALLLLWGVALLSASHGQRNRDPLAPAEVDQLRDQALEPDLRLKLFVQFARKRLDVIDKARSDPKVTDRGSATRDGLQDFLDVYDEMNDNVDAFEDQKLDFRKALHLIGEADVEFQAKLRALQASANSNRDEVKVYEFLLQTALDAVDSSAKDHRELLAEQEEAAKYKKKPSHK
jgi:hypothetical protein